MIKESDVQSLVNKSEAEYEERLKVEESMREIKRLEEIKANGGKLMSTGFRKWKGYHPTSTFRQIGGKQ